LKCFSGKQAARDQFFSELDLAGGEGGGGRFGKWAVEQFVVKQLVGDLGEAVRGEDGNGEGEAVVGVVVGFGDGGGEALAELNEAGEAENTEVASGVVVKKEDFGHGGVGWGGLVAASAGDFLEDLFHIGAGHIGFGQPVEGKEKIFRHPARGTQFGHNKGIGESAKIFHGGLRLFENIHAGGGGHRIEHQVIVIRVGESPKETICVLIRGIEWQDEGRGSVSHLQEGANEEKQDKAGTHEGMLSSIDKEESEDVGALMTVKSRREIKFKRAKR
jgi:hypothetical protein